VLLRLLGAGTAASFALLGGRSFRRSLDGADLTGYALGPEHGEPWLMLHGLGSTALSWAQVARSMRADCRMVLPELTELGGTRVRGGAIGLGDSVAILAHLIEDEFGGRPVAVAGISLGGWMAVRLALARPDLVSRLVLVVAGGYRDQDWELIQRLVTLRTNADVDRLYRALFFRVPWTMRLARRGFLDAFSSPAVTAVLTTTREEDVFGDQELARIACPTAVVWAEHDGLFPLAVGRRMAAALPASSFYNIPRCGHAAHWEQPRALVAALRDFRSRCPDPRATARRNAHGEARIHGLPGV
jgi:pimeloyl-ACP methyl ester carboxylesterase